MKIERYEYWVVNGINGYINDILKQHYDGGWEVAGLPVVNYDPHCQEARLYIPLKRKIYTPTKVKQNGE